MADEKPESQEYAVDLSDMPTADSNEQLFIAHDKREAAFRASAARRRKAAAADRPEARATLPEGRSTRPTTKS